MVKKMHVWFNRQNVVVQITVMLLFVFAVRTYMIGFYQVPTGSMETTMLVGDRLFADKLTPWFTAIKRNEIVGFNDPKYDYSANLVKNFWQRYVWGPTNWTKRVIGIPGDHVQGKIEDGVPVVYLNGVNLNESYKNKYPLIPVLTGRSDRPYMYFSYDPNKKWDNQPFYDIDAAKIVNHPSIPKVLEPGTPLPSGGDVFDVKLGKNQYWVMGDNRLGSSDSREFGVLDGKLIHSRIKFCIFSLDSLGDWWIFDLLRHPISFWSKVRWDRCLKFVKSVRE